MAWAPQYVEERRYTEEEYFEIERTSFGRWEYVNGTVRLMAGGSPDHGAICTNIVRALANALIPRGCRVYGSDVKIHTGDGVNTLPDVSAFCGEHRYYGGRADVLLNPLLIVEVVAPSTRDYDLTEKFDRYRTVASLQDYLLVEQDRARAMLYTRRGGYWELRDISGRDSVISLTSIGVTLAVTDVYALVTFGIDQL